MIHLFNMKAKKPILRKTPLKRVTKPIKRKTPLERSAVEIKRTPIKKTTAKIPIKSKNEIPKLVTTADRVFSLAIRKRDSDAAFFRCISCDKLKPISEMQCGHYISRSCSPLRFNELNAHGECALCNCHDTNHLEGYRNNLVIKIGLKNVEWLESHSSGQSYKWDRSFLQDIIEKYK